MREIISIHRRQRGDRWEYNINMVRTRNYISRIKHGFMLVFTGVVVLSVPGETKGGGGVPVRNHIKVSDVGETNKAGGFLYSDWLRPDATAANKQDVPVTFGSFVLSRSLLASVYDEVKNEWRQILQDNLGLQTAQGWLADTIADGQMGLADKWQHSSQEIYLQLAQTTTDSVLGAMAAGAEERAIVIRSVDWDLQLPVGDKDFQLGVNFLGPLHEKPDEAFLWQLRSYAGQNRTKGGNFGLIYRQARKGMFADDEAMYGGNAFLDYESGNDGDFWRWSLGVEYRSELLALYGNRYLALTDGEIQEDEYVYSADGYDVEAAWQLPEHPNVSGFVGYYLWEGENGDDDLKGIRYGTRLSFGEDGAQMELEFDSPEGSSKVKWGLQVSYLHKFGVPTSGAVETAERQFDPRNYFYDAVEREYAQKIRRSSSGGGGWRAAVVGLTGNAATLYAQLSNDEVLATLVGEKELPYSFNMLVNTTLAISTDIGASVLGDRDSFAMDLSAEPAVGSVTVSFIDEGRQLRLFPGAKVSLHHNGRRKPNIEYMVATIRMTLSPQQEQTDLQAWVDDDTLAVSLYEGAVAFAQNNAASVLVLGREAEARVWTMDGVTVVGGCGSGKERKNFVDDDGVAINAKTYCAPIVLEPVGAITVRGNLQSPILLTNISASGGSGIYRYSVVAGADFSFQDADLFLSPPKDFYLLTATVEVSDDTGVSTPGTLVVTVERAVEAIMANLSRGSYTVAHLEERVIETLSPNTGSPSYTFVLDDEAGVFGLVAAADDLSAELRINAVEGPALFIATVKINNINQVAIDNVFTVSVLPPVAAQAVNAQRFQMFGVIDNSFKSVVATITPSGGNGNYEYRKIADATDSFSTPDSNGVLSITAVNAVGTQALQVTVEVRDTFSAARMATVAVAVTVAGLSFSPLTVTSGVLAAGNILIDHFAEIESVSGCAGGVVNGKVSEITGDSLPVTNDPTSIKNSFDSGRYGIMVSVNLAGSYVYVITVSARCGGKADLSFSGAYRLDVANGSNEVFVPLQEAAANRTFAMDMDLQFRTPVSYLSPRYTLVAGGEYRNKKDDAALFTMDGANGMLMVSGGDERDGLYNNPYVLSVEISDSTSRRLTTAVSVVLISLLVRATDADLRGAGINSVTAAGEFSASYKTKTYNLSATEDFEVPLFAKSRGGLRIELVAGSTLALKSDDGSFVFVLGKSSEGVTWEFVDMPGVPIRYINSSSDFPSDASERSGEQVIIGPAVVHYKYFSSGIWYCIQGFTSCEFRNPTTSKLFSQSYFPAVLPSVIDDFSAEPMLAGHSSDFTLSPPFFMADKKRADNWKVWSDSHFMVNDYRYDTLAMRLPTRQAMDKFSYLWGLRQNVWAAQSPTSIAPSQLPIRHTAKANHNDFFMLCYPPGLFLFNKHGKAFVEAQMFHHQGVSCGAMERRYLTLQGNLGRHAGYA